MDRASDSNLHHDVERRVSHLSTHTANGQSNSTTNSFRISVTDFADNDNYSPVSPLSPSASPPLPQEDANQDSSRSISPPLGISPSWNNRNSTLKHGLGAESTGADGLGSTTSRVASQTGILDSDASRFSVTSRPESSASNVQSLSGSYRHRIQQVSFSYPRRTEVPQLQPTHPYGLYQQTTFEQPEEVEDLPHSSMPIGFTQRNDTFQRRTGPDGEELDVLGPDGHTEQLPPYTRYPEAGPLTSKSAVQTSSSANHYNSAIGPSSTTGLNPIVLGTIPPFSHTDSPIPSSNIGTPLTTHEVVSGLPLQQFHPHPSSYALPHTTNPSLLTTQLPYQQQSLLLPQPQLNVSQPQSDSQLQIQPQPQSQNQPQSTIPQSNLNSDSRAILSSVSSLAEAKKQAINSSKEAKRERLICGVIPLWTFAMACLLGLLLAIIAAGVIGGLMTSRKGKHHSDTSNTGLIMAATHDATQIPVPTLLPSLKNEKYFFPLGPFSGEERTCIDSSRDSIAWSCNVMPTLMLIDFQYDAVNGSGRMKLGSTPTMAGKNGILYGPQPPKVAEQKLTWVNDKRDPARGPALHFKTAYDKLVIFESHSFPPSSSMQTQKEQNIINQKFGKRHDTMPPDQEIHNHRFANSPGERPWYCYWNQTYIEGFIFIQQPVQRASAQIFNSSSMAVMENLKKLKVTSNVVVSVSIPSKLTPELTSTTTLQGRDVSANLSNQMDPSSKVPPPRFPYIVKLEEKRLPNAAFTPYCRQMQVRSDGSTVPLLNSNGKPIVEILKETASSQNNAQITSGVTALRSGHQQPKELSNLKSVSKRNMFNPLYLNVEVGIKASRAAKLMKRSQESPNSCHCVWVSPQN